MRKLKKISPQTVDIVLKNLQVKIPGKADYKGFLRVAYFLITKLRL